MHLSYSLLKLFLPSLDKSPANVAEILTNLGFEIEAVHSPADNMRGVIIGQIIDIKKHPNADKLQITQINMGNETIQIVTGATNIVLNNKVPVATVGAELAEGKTIKRGKLRGEDSNGMLCSLREVGLADEAHGIYILPEDAPIGTPLSEFLAMNDTILEVSPTANRGDALSILGLAREIGAFLGLELHLPYTVIIDKSKIPAADIEIKGEAGILSGYTAIRVDGVKVKESSDEIKDILRKLEMEPINNVVDLTNLVMGMYGQPTHAFDLSKLRNEGKQIFVTKLCDEVEGFATLDKVVRKLTSDNITINDGEKAVALAGVIGGLDSAISDTTTSIFIESAHFDSVAVRLSAKSAGMKTDSSTRFERGVDPLKHEEVAFILAELITKHYGGKIRDHKTVVTKPYEPIVIIVSQDYICKRVGLDLSVKRISQILTALGFGVEVLVDDEFSVTVPSWRYMDVTRRADIVEEIVRFIGFNNIPATIPASFAYSGTDKVYEMNAKMRLALAQSGFNEVVHYSLDDNASKRFAKPNNVTVAVANPVAPELSFLRESLLHGILTHCAENKPNASYLRTFELGKTYSKSDKGYSEVNTLTAFIFGGDATIYGKVEAGLSDMKAAVEGLIFSLNVESNALRPDDTKDIPAYLHPNKSYNLRYKNNIVASIGELHPVVTKDYKLKNAVILELNVDELSKVPAKAIKYASISVFPEVSRDLSLVCPKNVIHSDIVNAINSLKSPYILDVSIFDLFPTDEANIMGYRLRLGSSESTLTDEITNGEVAKVLEVLQSKLNVKLRG